MVNLWFSTTRSNQPVDSMVAGDPDPGHQGQVAALLTSQSITWTAAISAIGLLWAFAQSQFRDGANPAPWTTTPAIPIAIASVLMLIALASSWTALQGRSGHVAAILVAVVNVFLLTANFFVASGIATKTPTP